MLFEESNATDSQYSVPDELPPEVSLLNTVVVPSCFFHCSTPDEFNLIINGSALPPLVSARLPVVEPAQNTL